jgi:hypothetical protein
MLGYLVSFELTAHHIDFDTKTRANGARPAIRASGTGKASVSVARTTRALLPGASFQCDDGAGRSRRAWGPGLSRRGMVVG